MTTTIAGSNGLAVLIDDLNIARKVNQIRQIVGEDGWIDLRLDIKRDLLKQVFVQVIFKIEG